MKDKAVNLDKDFVLEIQAKKSDNKILQPAEEIDKANIYCLDYAYQYPFMPMIDLTFAFDELKKMVKKWLAKKDTIIY
ncbi:hypothetical protein [Chryseobacterium sp. NFX27]|uniref:hypothetical protein n=1 Tax=Chryseobacterium sp. NFX27 TaxID=2819618 RepID=UPI003CEAFF8C